MLPFQIGNRLVSQPPPQIGRSGKLHGIERKVFGTRCDEAVTPRLYREASRAIRRGRDWHPGPKALQELDPHAGAPDHGASTARERR